MCKIIVKRKVITEKGTYYYCFLRKTNATIPLCQILLPAALCDSTNKVVTSIFANISNGNSDIAANVPLRTIFQFQSYKNIIQGCIKVC